MRHYLVIQLTQEFFQVIQTSRMIQTRFTVREVRYDNDKIDSLSACIRLWPFFAAVFFIWKRVQATVLMSLELVICHVLSFSKPIYSPRKLDLLGVKIWLL